MIYTGLTNYIGKIVENKNITNFKSDYNVKSIFEHVSYDQGKSYIQYIKEVVKIDDN
jgi:hypothetical protein